MEPTSPHTRPVISMFGSHTTSQIARQLGITRNAVCGIIHRARRRGELPPVAVKRPGKYDNVSLEERLEIEREQRRRHWGTYAAKRRAQGLPVKSSRNVSRAPIQTQTKYALSYLQDREDAPRAGVTLPGGAMATRRHIFAVAAERRARAPKDPGEPLMLSVAEIRDSQCHWFYGDPRKVSSGYCGHSVDPGSAYCLCHRAMMYRGG